MAFEDKDEGYPSFGERLAVNIQLLMVRVYVPMSISHSYYLYSIPFPFVCVVIAAEPRQVDAVGRQAGERQLVVARRVWFPQSRRGSHWFALCFVNLCCVVHL